MKGHIRERSPGKWAIILDVPDPATGKRRRKWHSFSGTKKRRTNRVLASHHRNESGCILEPSEAYSPAFLEQWLNHIRSQVAPRTFERYEELARKNIAPLLGQAVLMKLRPAQISAAYAEALKSGRRAGQGGLAPRTVHHMHRILRQALALAVKWNLIVKNPADDVDPPKVERGKMRALDPTETAELIDHFRLTRMFMPVLLGFSAVCGAARSQPSSGVQSTLIAVKWQLMKAPNRLALAFGRRRQRAAERARLPCRRWS